jgi:hypothetical protein
MILIMPEVRSKAGASFARSRGQAFNCLRIRELWLGGRKPERSG